MDARNTLPSQDQRGIDAELKELEDTTAKQPWENTEVCLRRQSNGQSISELLTLKTSLSVVGGNSNSR